MTVRRCRTLRRLTAAVAAALAVSMGTSQALGLLLSPAENNKIAERFFDSAWNKGDFNSVAGLLSSKVIDHSPVPGKEEGANKFREIVGMFPPPCRTSR